MNKESLNKIIERVYIGLNNALVSERLDDVVALTDVLKTLYDISGYYHGES